MAIIYDITIFVAVLMIIVLFFGIWRNKFFERQNLVLGIKPLPFMGHMLQIFLNKEHFVETLQKIYTAGIGQR